MSNFKVYRKILSFSFVMFLIDLVGLAAIVGGAIGGYFIMNNKTDQALIGMGVGFLIGVIIAALISYLITNRFKAAQLAIIAKGVADGKLSDHPFKEGLESVKGRFGKITAFLFVASAIRGMFRQIGRVINRIGTAVGGDVGNSVTSAINAAVDILLGYLIDCCLGWIMYRKDVGTAQAGCEGACIFFKNGKSLLRNVGRIFGMGFLSLAIVGGAFFGLFYLIGTQFPQTWQNLANEIAEIGTRHQIDIPTWILNPTYLMYFICAIGAIVFWSTVHSVLIRPFILVGVMRNFMAVGLKNIPSEADFKELEAKSPKFAKLRKKM